MNLKEHYKQLLNTLILEYLAGHEPPKVPRPGPRLIDGSGATRDPQGRAPWDRGFTIPPRPPGTSDKIPYIPKRPGFNPFPTPTPGFNPFPDRPRPGFNPFPDPPRPPRPPRWSVPPNDRPRNPDREYDPLPGLPPSPPPPPPPIPIPDTPQEDPFGWNRPPETPDERWERKKKENIEQKRREKRKRRLGY